MTDLIDKANERAEQELQRAINASRGDLLPGEPGECELCGEWSGRLINSACAPCRDRYGLE